MSVNDAKKSSRLPDPGTSIAANSRAGDQKRPDHAPARTPILSRRALVDFVLTLVMLGAAFGLALASSALAAAADSAAAAVAAAASLLLAFGGGLYIVPKLARRVKFEFADFGIRTNVTQEGMLFLSLVVVVGLAAWNTENNLLYLILSALLAFIVASGIISSVVLRELGVRLRFPDHMYAGQPARLAITVTNRKPLLPSCSVTVEAHAERDEGALAPAPKKRKRKGPDPLRLAHFIVIPPRSGTKQVIEHTFAKRGRYRINGFTLSTRFPSGFFRKWRRVQAEGEIVVFPVAVPVDDFFHTLPMLAGSTVGLNKGEGVDLYSMREYRPTDHLRHIDWKASAKTRRVMVRETIHEEEQRLSIFFDTACPAATPGDDFGERFEKAITMGASLAEHFISEGAEVELVTPDSRVDLGAGRSHLHRILTELAVLMPSVPETADGRPAPSLLDRLPGVSNDRRFKILITSAPKGSIPGTVWRSAHVVYMDELPVADPKAS